MKSRFYLSTALSLVVGVAIVGVLSLHGGIFDRSTVINPGNLYPVLNFDNHGDGVYTFTARLADGYVYVSGPFCDSPGWTLSGETAILIYNSELDGNLASYFPVNIYGSFMPVGPGTEPPPIWNYNAEGRLTDYDYDVTPDYAQVDLDATDPSAEFHSTLADIPCPSDWTATLTSGPGQWSQTGTGESFVVRPEQPGEYEIRGEYEDQYDTARLDAFRLQWEFDPNVIAVGKTAPVKFFLEGPEGVHKLYTFSIDPAAKAALGNGPALDLDTRKHDLLVNGIAASGAEEDTSIRNDQNPKIVPFTVVDMNPYLFEDFVIVDHPDEETVFVEFRPILVSKGTFTVTLTAPGNGAMTAEDDMGKLLTSGVPLVYNLAGGDDVPLWFDIKREGNAGGVATFSFVYDGGAEYAKLEKTLDVDVYKLTFDPAPITLYVGEEKDVKAKLEGPPKALGMLYTTEDCQHVVPVAMQVAHQAGAEVEIKIIGIKPSEEEPDDCALYGYFPDNRAMSAKIKVKSIQLDLEMERVSENEEESPGGFIMVNDDDDNEDLNVDRDVRHETGGGSDPDLRRLAVRHGNLPEISPAHPLVLSLLPLTADARIWRSPDRSGAPLIALGRTTARFTSADDVPDAVWAEGVSPDICEIKLAYCHPMTGRLEDRVKATFVQLDINLAGLPNEKTIRAPGGDILRIEPFEFSTGASLQVNRDRSISSMKKLTIHRPTAGSYPGRHIEITWPTDKIDLYPEPDFRSGILASPLAVPVADFPPNGRLYYYVNPVSPSDSGRDILIHARMTTPDPTSIVAEDKIRATNLDLDLDVDSNNDGIVQADDPEEDKIEYVPFDRNPGKIVMLNDGDEDADGIPDFADFEITTKGNAPPRFAEVHCRLKTPLADELRFKLLYSGSDPARTTASGPAKGALRLWKKSAEELRSPAAVKDGGDFLAPSRSNDPDSWYSVADLFGPEGTAIFHLEAVNPISTPHDPTTTVRIVAALANDAAPASLAEDAVRICVANVRIAMDGNRNGQISFDDPADKQCLFWVNNDHDYVHFNEGMYQEDDGNSPATPNCLDDAIGAGYYDVDSSTFIDMPCKRDLEDFTQLHLQVDATLGLLPDISYHFQFTDVSFSQPEVNLFRAISPTFEYLNTTKTANEQVIERRILTVGSDDCEIDAQHIKISDLSAFLLEGRQAGKGRLAFIVKSAGVEIARASLFLDLREIAEFYQRYKVDITHGDHVETTPHQAHGAYTYRPGTDDYILFVHGYNVKEWEVERWTETMFKRLWWQGYDGHVGMYRWPEQSSPWFNQSEIRAWRSAEGLTRLFERLDSRHPGKVRVLAHSQGNAVVSEALQLSSASHVHTYIATQAAISAHMFDGRLRDYDFAKEFSTIFGGFETPNIYAHYWSGTPATRPYFVETGFRGKVGRTCNFANEQDYALAWWRYNNILKPAEDMGYGYAMPLGFFRSAVIGVRWLSFPDNRDEIFSYCAESRSNALGATAFRVQGFDSRYMLQRPPLSYNNHHYSHSRQFRSNIIDERTYWREIINHASLTLMPRKD